MKKKKLKKLLKSLTLEEKIGQLVQLSGDFFNADEKSVGPGDDLGISSEMVKLAGSVLNVSGAETVIKVQKDYLEKSRHKIPLAFMDDVIYSYKTCLPIPLAMASSWNPDYVKKCISDIAHEAASGGCQATFAPMVDLAQDCRWGRVMESPGEDPYLNGVFARAMVEGFQGDMSLEKNVASCIKHYAAYGAAQAGRDYNTVDMSRRRLLEEYLPPYYAGVKAGCNLVMTSFNTIEGIPATGNSWLLDEVLRQEWGFNGVILTDFSAIKELVAHGVAKDDLEAARLAFEASVDIDMKSPCYANELKEIIEQNPELEEKLDQAVYRVLKLKNKLGLFKDPYRGISPQKEEKVCSSKKHKKHARKMAAKSVVLLKNDNQTLPVTGKKTKIGLIGPYSDSKSLTGFWSVFCDKDNITTLKEALGTTIVSESFKSTKGCEMIGDEELKGVGFPIKNEPVSKEEQARELKESIEIAEWADIVFFAIGEHSLQSGEGGSRTELQIPKVQQNWLKEVLPHAKKKVALIFSGRPLVLTELEKDFDAILQCWFPGSEGAYGIADVLLGKVNPSARLTMSFPYTVGQCPISYRQFNTGRPTDPASSFNRFTSRYIDAPNEPLYPFGYGLSYNTVEYSQIELSSTQMHSNESITASIRVTNTGKVKGEETVQLYLQDMVGSVVRLQKELVGFNKVTLDPGETKTVQFEIRPNMLKFYNQKLQKVLEPGEFTVYIGQNSSDCKSAQFTLVD